MPSTTQRLAPFAFAPQWTAFVPAVPPSTPPRISSFESITGWQSPIARTASTRVPVVSPTASIRSLSTIQGAAPPQSSAQMPCESSAPPQALTLFARITVPAASPIRRTTAPTSASLPQSAFCSTTELGASSSSTA